MLGKSEELILVLVIILILFGAKKLPELARSIGQSAKEVRKGFEDDVNDEEEPAKKSTATKKTKKS